MLKKPTPETIPPVAQGRGWRTLPLIEYALGTVFPSKWNPFHHLGALTLLLFWVVLVSGVYELVFFETSVRGAYASVEYLTRDQWWLGGVMRSLHRYASDAAVITMMLHLVREFIRGHYRGFRWFSWLTGIPLVWMVIPLGITGYWMVWDTLAQYIAIGTSELLDALPFFTDPMARNFLTDSSLSDRFFTLIAFIHIIGIPIFLLFGIWFHLLRIVQPKINPPARLAIGTLVTLLVLSLVKPALSHAPANLTVEPVRLQLDWFYLNLYPLLDEWQGIVVWGVLVVPSLLLALLPWLPSRRLQPVATVDLEQCSGCGRCFDDCPYSAVIMQPRSDTRRYPLQAEVNADLCAGCGICAGSCPSSSPFRRIDPFVTGIDIPQFPVDQLRASSLAAAKTLTGMPRILVYGCDHGADVNRLKASEIAAISLPCIGLLPPSCVEYLLSQGRVDGVMITGCGTGDCEFRLGNVWTEERLSGQREPRLRARVDRTRVRIFWASARDQSALAGELETFRATLENAGSAHD